MRVASNRLLQVVLAILILAVAVLAVTPLLIKHFAVRWLEENGGDQVRFHDVDLNPFTGELVLKGLDVKVDDDTTLSFSNATVDVAWLPLWRRQVVIEAVALSDLNLVVHQLPGQTRIGGIRLPAAGEEPPPPPEPASSEPWMAGIDRVTLNNIRVRYVDARLDLALVLDHLQLDNLAQWSEQTPTPLSAAGSLNGAAFTLSGEITPLAATPRYDLKLKLQALPLAPFARLAQAQLAGLDGKLSYDGTVAFQQLAQGFRLDQAGGLRLQDYAVRLKQPAVAVQGADNRIDSQLELSDAGDGLQLQLISDIQLADLDVSAEDGRLALLRSAALKLDGLGMQGVDNITLKSLQADKLALARRSGDGDTQAPVDIERLRLTTFAMADNLLSIDSIAIDGMQRRLHRDRDGALTITGVIDDIRRLTAEDGSAEAAAQPASGSAEANADETEAQAAMAIAIGSIEIADSAVGLLDESVQPPLQAQVDIRSLRLAALDSRKPQQNSPVALDAAIGKHSSITLNGDLRPFMQPPGVDVESNISALELPPLSPYAQSAMGLELDSGTLDADVDVRTDSKAIDGLVKLKLYQLQLKTVESENSLQSQLPVPINVALDTLRDGNNTIALKIPIKGDPANPDFNINDALTKALADGVQKGALTYLTLALQPYGAMITAAKYAGEAISKVRLKPVDFPAGGSQLDAGAEDYLSKVAKVLADRPQLAVKVCGVAVEQDRIQLQQQAAATQGKSGEASKASSDQSTAKPPPAPAIDDERLRTLAQARADAVRNHLVEKFKAPASRLVACQPRIDGDASDKAAPRTDLLL